MASNALLELAKVVRFYSDVSNRCPLAAKACVSIPDLLHTKRNANPIIAQPILESLFDRARATYLHSRYGLHHDAIDPDDELCKIAVRSGLLLPTTNRAPAPVPADADSSPFSPDVAHSALMRVYEDMTANVPPPNDPILMPGQLHRPSNGAGMRNGASSVSAGTGGFGVSAERSGCQSDGYGGSVGAGLTAQHFKWLSSESSEYTWMTWF